MTKKIISSLSGWIFVVGIFCLLAVGQGGRTAWICLGAWGVFPVISYGMNLLLKKKLEAEFQTPATVEKREGKTVCLQITNPSWIPAACVLCSVEMCNRLTGERTEEILFMSAPSRGTVRKELSISSDKCGYLELSVRKSYLMDWAGFLPVKCSVQAEGRVAVLPDTFEPRVLLKQEAARQEDADSWSQERKGNDAAEVFSLREYAEGDSLRQIHWKLSSKRQQLIVKEASFPVEKSLLLFWDKNAAASTAEEMDAMAECTVSIAQELVRQGITFTLGWSEGREEVFEEIQTEEDNISAIPRMLKYGAEILENEETFGSSGRISAYGINGRSFGKIIYFGKTVPEHEIFAGESAVTMVVCDKEVSHPVFPVVVFTAENYQEDLETIEL